MVCDHNSLFHASFIFVTTHRLEDDKRRVERILIEPENIQTLCSVFGESPAVVFRDTLESFVDIVKVSPNVAKALGGSAFVSLILERLGEEVLLLTSNACFYFLLT